MENGQRNTQTPDIDSVPDHFERQKQLNEEDETCFNTLVLTQTVAPSSLANWILVVCLRDPDINDLAFIGNDFVQIKELHGDGYLYDLIRKEGFGSRIRNARVVGSISEYNHETETYYGDEKYSMHLDPCNEDRSRTRRRLPPQHLVLQLCSGDVVFAGIHTDEFGSLSWTLSWRRIEKSAHKLQVGMHLSIEPTSRFIALGCSEGIIIICALISRERSREKYTSGFPIQYIESEFQIFIEGAILHMEFLFPNYGEEKDAVILLVITAWKGKTRMFFYTWDISVGLSKISPLSSRGYLLPDQRKLPLLLIPLHIKTSFILVYESVLSVYEGMLKGSPAVADYDISVNPPLKSFYGLKKPLWISWSRPPRVYRYKLSRDDFFLIREDGLVTYVQTDDETDGLINAHTNVGDAGFSTGSAVTSLSYSGYDPAKFGADILIIGGDSCIGGSFLLLPQCDVELCQPFKNWHPAHDLTILSSSKNQNLSRTDDNSVYQEPIFSRPERIFVCCGKGSSGAIAELRHGLEAKIGLISDYASDILQSWVFHDPFNDDKDDQSLQILLLLSLENSSAVLQLAGDGTAISELEESSAKFDVKHRTITALQKNTQIIQVTEKSIVRCQGGVVHMYDANQILCIQHQNGDIMRSKLIHNAIIKDDFVVFTTSVRDIIYVQVLAFDDSPNPLHLDSHAMALSNARISTISKLCSRVTCLAMGLVRGARYVIVSQWDGQNNILSFLPLDAGLINALQIPNRTDRGFKMEAIISLSFQNLISGNSMIICGTRDGLIFTFELNENNFTIVSSRYDRIGVTSVEIFKDEYSIYGHLVVCDSVLYALMPTVTKTKYTGGCVNCFKISRFWLTDALEPGFLQPEIQSIASQPIFHSGRRVRDFLVTTKSHILIVSMGSLPQTIPRQICLGGTPSRLIYSDILDVFIVAILIEGKSNLLFIDPKTGQDISYPIDQNTKMPVKFISGLGHRNEKIYRLFEWVYTKKGREWNFIILSTSLGRVLIISIDRMGIINKETLNSEVQLEDNSGRLKERPKIIYYTRYKFWAPEPVYSAIGYPDGLLWCAGRNLYCDALDLTDKKFKRLAEFELPSPAVNLDYEDGVIYALTLSHSLEILKLVTCESGITELVRTHGDPVTRPSLNHIVLKSKIRNSVHLVSDKFCKVVGLRSTQNVVMDTIETVFEAQISDSIIKLRSGICRPLWDPVWALNKVNSSSSQSRENSFQHRSLQYTLENYEIFGLSITGSLIHLTFLDLVSWKFLRFLNNLAIKSPKICEFTYQDNSNLDPLECKYSPKTMLHIDGDILKRCLQKGLIEDILGLDPGVSNVISKSDGMSSAKTNIFFIRLYHLLQELHHGDLMKGEIPEFYIRQAYLDLEFFLRPVF